MNEKRISLKELLQQDKGFMSVSDASIDKSLEQQLSKVAKQAAADYVSMLIKSKKQGLQEQIDREGEILSVLHEIQQELVKNGSVRALEENVLLDVKRVLAKY